MKLRYLFLFGLLICVAIALTLRYAPYFQQSVNNMQWPVFSLSDARVVSSVLIHQGEQELIFKQEKDQWYLTDGVWSDKVIPGLGNSLIDAVRDLYSLGIATQMDDTSLLEKALWTKIDYYSDRQLEGALELTRMELGEQMESKCICRIPNASISYFVKSDLCKLYLRPKNAFREPTFLEVLPGLVQKIHLLKRDSIQKVLFKQDSIWIDQNGNSVNGVGSYLNQFKSLELKNYASNFNEFRSAELWESILTFNLENQDSIMVEIFAYSTQIERPFILQSSQHPGRFIESDSTGPYKLFLEIFDQQSLEDGEFNSNL